MVYHAINKHHHWDLQCLLSVFRGFRNGVITGVRVRIPYIFQAVIYAIVFREGNVFARVKFVLKQMLYHGRNLAMFVGIYKGICCVLRNMNIDNGVESLIAGFIGGCVAFGDNNGVSGSVNNQIVLYLFARSVQGFIQSSVHRGILPEKFGVMAPTGFRIFAGVTLAMALYLTEHESDTLSSSFMSTMNFLYHKSDESLPLIGKPEKNFAPIIFLVACSLLGYFGLDSFSLENIIYKFLG
eukprot:TRINITY_DN3614_c0_g1_i1.p1 TRINITY_DN3614_c0_g1~~TRINITY_DN3614_c0_g1_i1.p1  ORF type:complete len:240 (-),score=41.18 TRINITY_DN3614_c0_g1_i1:49-768(-)